MTSQAYEAAKAIALVAPPALLVLSQSLAQIQRLGVVPESVPAKQYNKVLILASMHTSRNWYDLLPLHLWLQYHDTEMVVRMATDHSLPFGTDYKNISWYQVSMQYPPHLGAHLWYDYHASIGSDTDLFTMDYR